MVIYTSETELNKNVSFDHIGEDINDLQTWCRENAITMNINKTKYIKFGTKYA